MIKILISFFMLCCFSFSAWSKAIIDPDVTAALLKGASTKERLTAIVFVPSLKDTDLFSADLNKIPHINAKKFASIPAVLVSLPADTAMLNRIAHHPVAMHITSFHGGYEELEFSEQAILLKPSFVYPHTNNWWANGYTGKNQVVGIIDSGIALEHTSLMQKQIIVRKEPGSGYEEGINGVRSAHGTGVACIYAGTGNGIFPNDLGVAHDAPFIVTGLAGEGDGNMGDLAQTLSTLDWMLSRAIIKPNIINYSYGNGPTNCTQCSDWSGLAKIVDYVVNHYHILWVKSAGNGGYIESTTDAPYAATLSVPADNYNAFTVANMNPILVDGESRKLNPNRDLHAIRYTSSRGPTLNGRKKPDISAPGNDTRTCAPDPAIYSFSYTQAMDYHDGYRLMGGTSSAAPHVGAAALLLQEGGITSPMAIKALLINSADAYTDSGTSGPDDPKYPYQGGHYPVMGSEWNRTYGWGYLNMQKAYEERGNLIEDKLTLDDPERVYKIYLPVGGKVTLVHERRVGYSNANEWRLSHLSLELVDEKTNHLLMRDESAQDTVHQVANCQREAHEKNCSSESSAKQVLVKVRLLGSAIDGAKEEPYSLVWSAP